MINFQTITPELYDKMHPLLEAEKSCEYSFVNLCIWGNQRTAQIGGHYAFFSQFDRHMVYLFPVGSGDVKPVIDAILEDAHQRGIRCYLTGLDTRKCQLLEQFYPGRFRFHTDRNEYDYYYRIEDLATLKGRKYLKKRNHVNAFRVLSPNSSVEPLSKDNQHDAIDMVQKWYDRHQADTPEHDFYLEQTAFYRAMKYLDKLPLEGLLLRNGDEVIAVSLASPLSREIFDVHFEKASDSINGSYAAINQALAAYLMNKYPNIRYLDREEDMGLEGLRKAKLSYHPDHLAEKYWATLKEDNHV